MRAVCESIYERGKRGIKYLRRRVPSDLCVVYGRTQITRSLGTSDLREAKSLAHAEQARLEEEFQRARGELEGRRERLRTAREQRTVSAVAPSTAATLTEPMAVIDLFSRQVAGWSMKPHMRRDMVIDALRMAWCRRRPEAGLIFHSDRGSQYCSGDFQAELTKYGMRSSMSHKGNCWDNAPTESLWGSLKVGRLHGQRFATRREAMDEIVDWLTFYNHRRLHSSLGYVSHMQFEKAWLAAQQRQAAYRSQLWDPGNAGKVKAAHSQRARGVPIPEP